MSGPNKFNHEKRSDSIPAPFPARLYPRSSASSSTGSSPNPSILSDAPNSNFGSPITSRSTSQATSLTNTPASNVQSFTSHGTSFHSQATTTTATTPASTLASTPASSVQSFASHAATPANGVMYTGGQAPSAISSPGSSFYLPSPMSSRASSVDSRPPTRGGDGSNGNRNGNGNNNVGGRGAGGASGSSGDHLKTHYKY